jgi:phage terminase large subunit GpA-like protein
MLRPPIRLALSQWADDKFRLPEGDANAGKWRSLPYQIGIMDAISDPWIERITVMKSARVGFTKMFCCAVGYFIEHDPCPIMLVQPTLDDARLHSKEDIAPMLRDVPDLRGLIAEPKSRDSDNTILNKLFRGGSLSMVGANSARGFRRTSRRVVIFDEVDGYPVSAGTEGDQIALGIRRTEYYWNRKIISGSTPTIAGSSRIEALFEEGDQRRYYVPCPQCGTLQVLRFPNLKWPEGKPEQAYFVCEKNACVIEEADKRAMVAAGRWVAEEPDHFTETHRHASFHIWAAYSYSPNATWGQLAAEFVTAKHGGPLTLKTFINTALGETWKDRGEAPDWERLMRRRESYAIGSVPMGALLVTAGVDVQGDRIVVEVVAWGRGKISWSVDYAVIPGDPSDLVRGPWRQVEAFLDRTYMHAGGTPMPIAIMAVDSGWNTQVVYGWARQYPMSRVIATKGMPSGGSVLIGAPSPVEVSDRGRKLKHGYRSWPVSGHIAKSELYGWLRLELPTDGGADPPGYCHFPEYNEDYFRQLTAEQIVPVKNRRGFVSLEWSIISGRENHVLDCRCLARAAASVAGLDRFSEADWRTLEKSVGQEPVVVEASPVAEAKSESADRTPSPPPRRGPWLRQRAGWLRN